MIIEDKQQFQLNSPMHYKRAFVADISVSGIFSVLEKIIQSRKGVILERSEMHIRARFGSRWKTRMFGAWTAQFTNSQLPTILDVSLDVRENRIVVSLDFSDNMGSLFVRDPYAFRSIFRSYFEKFTNEILDSCCGKDVTQADHGSEPV